MTELKPINYQFYIRSFHPKKDFGWSGLYFEGDDRGFSNTPRSQGAVTSRIWHKFNLGMASGDVIPSETGSDLSRAPWSDKPRSYDGVLKPKGVVQPIVKRETGENIKRLSVKGSYGGVNHAMPGSPTMQKKLGFSYVPTLDVSYEIKVDFDLANMHMDIVTYIKGDGFPNCEAFVVDESGQSVFLGIHVRKGAAPVTLALNLDYPMIMSAIRLPLLASGNFAGKIGDELDRIRNNKTHLVYKSIKAWNSVFLAADPDARHCMLLEKSTLKGCFN